jgi:type I restriction enzyme S subunit
MTWQKIKLQECVEFYDYKRVPLSAAERKKRKGKYPYYGASGVIDYVDNYLFDGEYLLISEDGNNLVTRNTPIAFMAKGKYWVNNHAHIVKGIEQKAKSRYVMYWLETNDILGWITGAAQPKLSQGNLASIEIPLPTYEEQIKILEVISAYDDLIENNTRRIQLLEQLAQTIYKEWFVNFRFPGYEKTMFVDSPLGKIPKGWEVKSLGNVANFVKGKSYKSSELSDVGGLPFANLKCIQRNGGFRLEGIKRFNGSYKENQKVVFGDIVFAVTDMTQNREVVGRPARIPRTNEEFMIISLDLVKIEPLQVNKSFLYSILKYSSFGDEIKEYANGVNVLHLNPKIVEEYKILIPTINVLTNFSDIVKAFFDMIDTLNIKINNLRRTRDLLLPKLMSGEVEV